MKKSNKIHLSIEETMLFLEEHEAACQTMEIDDFAQLFLKYDLSFIDDYTDVMETIANAMMDWKKEFRATKLHEVRSFDSKCIFCSIGKKVKVYKWSYLHTKAIPPMNRQLCYSQIAFMFDIQDGCLVNYGTCNAYLNHNDIKKNN